MQKLVSQGEGAVTLGSSGRAVCLVSGGIDSPVAAWLIMRAGVLPIFAYFDSYPLVDASAKDIALDAMRKLAEHFPRQRFRAYIVPHAADLEEISSKCPINLACLLSRRLMLRVAYGIAKLEGADAIVTGDAVGQKASQTLHNLRVIDAAVPGALIVRPLVGMNKADIVRISREIGTYSISIRPGVASCGIPADKPRTRALMEEIERAEARLGVEAMVRRSLESSIVLEI